MVGNKSDLKATEIYVSKMISFINKIDFKGLWMIF